ncbi:MAG: hypothetical protein LUH01_08465 [Parabacteroides gordonii]|nr:hypothetical protein [Parabacteroides gordonii]
MKTTFTRMVCRCLLIAVACCMLPVTGWGQADVWDGSSIASNFSGGDGNEATPYLISSGAELAYLAKGVNDGSITTSDKYFKLTNDIDLNDQAWTPIGRRGYYFQGNFDGDNHTISNLYISKETAHVYAGLFGYYYFTSDVTIKNLGITVGQLGITGKGYAGGLAGRIEGDHALTLTIENCFVTGSLIDSDCKEGISSSAGGMIGLITGPPLYNQYYELLYLHKYSYSQILFRLSNSLCRGYYRVYWWDI